MLFLEKLRHILAEKRLEPANSLCNTFTIICFLYCFLFNILFFVMFFVVLYVITVPKICDILLPFRMISYPHFRRIPRAPHSPCSELELP